MCYICKEIKNQKNMKKERSFLMGSDAIRAFKNGGASFLINCKDKYEIYKFTEGETLEEIMIKVIGWDEYLELNGKDLLEIKTQKNRNQWDEFYKMVDPEGEMTDGEFIDYLYKHYQVPTLFEGEPVEEVDLFDNFDLLPEPIRILVDTYCFNGRTSYDVCAKLVHNLNLQGYTCEFGLDAQPINLKKI